MANGPPETPAAAVGDTSTGEVSGVARDVVVGAAGGFVGTALATGVLLVGQGTGAFETGTVASLAVLVGLGGVFSPAVLEAYLPGRTLPERGLAFGTGLWIGFAPAFYGGGSGWTLAGYPAITLVAHWAYGFGLGAVVDYPSNRPEPLV